MSNRNVISWNDNFLIGDKNIDKEHKVLFKIAKKANEINTLNDEESKKKVLKKITKELHDYAKVHFSNEEEFMKGINYPFISEHKLEHTKMIENLEFISLNLEIISSSESSYSIYDFVHNIFVKHIISQDTKIIKHLN